MEVGVLYQNIQIHFKFETPNSLRNSEHRINQIIRFQHYRVGAAKSERILYNIN